MDKLNPYTIRNLFSRDDPNKRWFDMNCNLQILSIWEYTPTFLGLCLSDSVNFYEGFLLRIKNVKKDLEELDIITVRSVLKFIDTKGEEMFEIKIKDDIEKFLSKIGNPIAYETNYQKYKKELNKLEPPSEKEAEEIEGQVINEFNLDSSGYKDPQVMPDVPEKVNTLSTDHLANINTNRRNFLNSSQISQIPISPIKGEENTQKSEDLSFHVLNSFKKSKSQEKINRISNGNNKENSIDAGRYSLLETKEKKIIKTVRISQNKSGMLELSKDEKKSDNLNISHNLEEKIIKNFNEPKINPINKNRDSTVNIAPRNRASLLSSDISESNIRDFIENNNIENQSNLPNILNPIHNQNIPQLATFSARQIQPINQKATKIPIQAFNRPKTTGKKYFTPLAMLSSMNPSFNTMGQVIDIQYYPNYFNIVLEDSNNTFAKVQFSGRLFQLFKDKIKFGKHYIISNGEVTDVRQKRFIGNRPITVEIKLNNSSNVEDYNNENRRYTNFITLKELEEYFIQNVFVVDILLYVLNIIRDSNKNKYFNTKLICTDASYITIDVSLTNQLAEKEIKYRDVLWIKNAVIIFNNGYSIITSKSTFIEINPDKFIEKVNYMKDYCDAYRGRQIPHNEVYKKHIGLKYVYIKDILERLNDKLFANDPYTYVIFKARITEIIMAKHNTFAACPICTSQVKQELRTPNKCQSCNKFRIDTLYCYRFKIKIADCSDWTDIVIFGEVGERLLKLDANRFTEAIYNNDMTTIKNLNNLANQLKFKLFYFHVRPTFQWLKATKELTLVNFEEIYTKSQINDESQGLIKKLRSELK